MYQILLYKALFVTSVIFITLMGNRLVNLILNNFFLKIAKKTKTKFDDEMLPLVQRLLNIGVWVTCTVILATSFGINVTALYAGLGVSSMIAAMCIKESIINIIAGVTIMFDRPFRVGDRVKLHTGDKGYVHKIGLRRTQICIPIDQDDISLPKFKSILVIPNKDISKYKIYNYTYAEELAKEL